jgi:hypothetical protein
MRSASALVKREALAAHTRARLVLELAEGDDQLPSRMPIAVFILLLASGAPMARGEDERRPPRAEPEDVEGIERTVIVGGGGAIERELSEGSTLSRVSLGN